MSQLVHPPDYYFRLLKTASAWSPGTEKRHEIDYNYGHPVKWATRLKQVTSWLTNLKREVGPDLWASLQEAKNLQTTASSQNIENAPFTSGELKIVEAKLDELKQYIIETSHPRASKLNTWRIKSSISQRHPPG